MKHALLSLLICCLSVAVTAAEKAPARPDLVREVIEGKRHEARASWWGFDRDDSTDFLQAAINSRAKKLIIDRQGSPWVTRPLTGVSNQEIVIQSGTKLIAKAGAFQGKGECLLSFNECRNVTIRGESSGAAQILMRKADYQSGAYAKSEWRHGLSFSGCTNVLIQDLTIAQTGGDGIYLGASQKTGANRNVVIRRVDCDDNHRQGISVISAENLLIEHCRLRNTSGTEPQAGIDFEPNSPNDVLINCIMRHCIASDNSGTGYQICPQQMNSSSKPISITFEHCVSRGNRWHAIHLCSAQKDQPRGALRVTDLLSEKDGLAGLSIQFNPFNAIRIEMTDSTITDAAMNDKFFAPIYVQGVTSDNRPMGSIHLRRVTIKDEISRPFIRLRDPKGNGITGIDGQVVVEKSGHVQHIRINDNWLRRYAAGTDSGKH